MTGKEIVGPVPTMRMRDGTVLTVDVPRNTLDPRYMLCRQHSTGCDCYEAERNEQASEYQTMWELAREAAREVCAGHPTFPDYYDQDRSGWTVVYAQSDACCQCTGCQIIRKAYL